MDVSSEPELSDVEESDLTCRLDRRVGLGSVDTVDDLSVGFDLLVLDLVDLQAFLRAGGPPTSITLLTPRGSNLVTLVLTMLTAANYSPKSGMSGK
jgi:hypothetical protein